MTIEAPAERRRALTREERKVIIASSAGTVFEWYDFYLYGSLATIIGAQFFAAYSETQQSIFALLTFAAGFIVRPFGAIIFGRLGDIVGRKYTFVVTVVLMGAATFLVGLLPSYHTIGVAAPIALIVLRMLQGLAAGGEYGGAAVYVAEHAPQNQRGFFTSWVNTTPTLALLLSLIVIMFTQIALDASFPPVVQPDGTSVSAFKAWGWRIPFLLSAILLIISLYVRLQMQESPAFQRMKAEGAASTAPLREAFGEWRNIKIGLIALFGLVAGQAVVWYTAHFYTLFFIQNILQVDQFTTNVLVAWALIVGVGFVVAFASLSDRVGRKPLILGGCALAVLTYFPLFEHLTRTANPALYRAQSATEVTVAADPADCSFQFNPTGGAKFSTSCDIAKSALAKRAVHYRNEDAPAGSIAIVRIGKAEPLVANAARFLRQAGGRVGGGGLSDARPPRDGEDSHRPGGGPRQRRSRVRHLERAEADHHRHPRAAHHVRRDDLRADRLGARGAVPDAHPLLGHVAALSHRQWLVRRAAARHLVRHRGGDGQYLLGALVSGRHRRGDCGHRRASRARNAQTRRRVHRTQLT